MIPNTFTINYKQKDQQTSEHTHRVAAQAKHVLSILVRENVFTTNFVLSLRVFPKQSYHGLISNPKNTVTTASTD